MRAVRALRTRVAETSRLRGRTVLLLHPIELPIVACLLLVAVIFGIAPDTLEHTAVSFEQRGIIHHVWHWVLLLGGAVLTLVGLLTQSRIAFRLEFAGLVALIIAFAVNLIAVMTSGDQISGLALATRSGMLLGLGVRAWIVLTQPTIVVRATRDDV